MTILMVFGQWIFEFDYPFSCPTGRQLPYREDFNDEVQFKVHMGFYEDSQEKLLHFTYIFNTFVFLQLFNFINCRKIGMRDFNVFESITHNFYFIVIVSGCTAAQFFISEYLSGLFNTRHMTKGEWGACIMVGSTPLLIAFILKWTPVAWVEKIPSSRLINEDYKLDNKVLSAFKKVTSSKDDGFKK